MPSVSDDAFLARVCAVCCRVWGIAPWEFRAAMEREEVLLRDVIEAVILGSAELNVSPWKFIYRERSQDRKKRREQVNELIAEYQATTDETKRKALMELMEKLNTREG
jgi:hypothetical protein